MAKDSFLKTYYVAVMIALTVAAAILVRTVYRVCQRVVLKRKQRQQEGFKRHQ